MSGRGRYSGAVAAAVDGAASRRTALLGAVSLAIVPFACSAQENPYLAEDDTWISLSGEVEDVRADAFTLDFGEGTVTVEMDDGDRDADGYKLIAGDRVTVNGLVDEDFYETTTIEASSVYVEKLNTYFFASARDEEELPESSMIRYTLPIVPSDVVLEGRVVSVDQPAGTLTLSRGHREITVSLERLGYDPLDDEGYQRIDTGDRVRIAGLMENELFEARRLEATSIITLSD